MRPRRSVLYMPGANSRAMEKAQQLDCDSIIFDLEDAVAPDAKDQARAQVITALTTGNYGYRERVVRCNGMDTPWGEADLKAFAALDVDALLLPKIESRAQIETVVELLGQAGATHTPLWVMIETPAGVLDLEYFADHPRIEVLVMGTSDLVKELRGQHTQQRHNIDYALQRCVLIARRYDKVILDGVHLDFRNADTFAQSCAGGRAMGFDGKTLIHPSQIEGANSAFGYSSEDVEHAEAVLAVWEAALAAGKGVAELDGQLIENLHAGEAQQIVAFAAALRSR